MFRVIRHYYKKDPKNPNGPMITKQRVIKTGLTLDEARAHCHDPETCSDTCRSPASRGVTRRWRGHWFDSYSSED